MDTKELRYLEQLSELYPTIGKASTEIINLQSILNLPKGTEHFISDIHGEYEAFSHVLHNGSGAVRKKIDDVFGHTLSTMDKSALATLIYYPKQKIELVRQSEPDIINWYKITLYRLIEVCKVLSSKYTRSKVRKALPEDYGYIIEELITEKSEVLNKEAYYEAIVNTIVEIGNAEAFIISLAKVIQQLVIDRLHVLGDIFDRGPAPHLIMDRMSRYHSVDFQWGNHDILWMGAATGHPACIANVVRNCVQYSNLGILEDGYGINMVPLATFALATYGEDECKCFELREKKQITEQETDLLMKMHKAIVIIKFKLEGQLARKRKEFGLENRCFLHCIDYQAGKIRIDDKEYEMLDTCFPTINPDNPYELTEEEQDVMNRLSYSFLHCEKLQRHVQLLLNQGSLYKVYNNNLLYHGCVPMNEDGTFAEVTLYGETYKGKKLYDMLESYVRKAFFADDIVEKEKGADIMWYLWNAPSSPLYGRSKMSTFERYFIADKELHKEVKNPYYKLIEDAQHTETAETILKEFGLEVKTAHIINGHVPVHRMSGESPVKCGGKVIVIDGGFSKTYRSETGIAGYTLVFNSYGLTLTAHEPFVSKELAISKEIDIVSRQEAVERMLKRMLVGDTDQGKKIKERIADLKTLIAAYRCGEIVEKR